MSVCLEENIDFLFELATSAKPRLHIQVATRSQLRTLAECVQNISLFTHQQPKVTAANELCVKAKKRGWVPTLRREASTVKWLIATVVNKCVLCELFCILCNESPTSN